MADPKTATTEKPASAPQPDPIWTGDAKTERYCGRCLGMVNGNGCADPLCPLSAK